ncbi:MFS transporter [Salmonella enterica]
MNGLAKATEVGKEKNQSILIAFIIPLIALTVVTQLYILLPVVNVLNQILKTNSGQTSLLTTFFGIFYAIGFLLWGVMSDKYGREKVIVIGLTGLGVITAIIPFINNYQALLVIRSMQGLIASSYPPVILAWIAENYNDKYKKLLISFLSCSFLLSGTLGQLYGAVMIKNSLVHGMISLAVVYILGGMIFALRKGKSKTRDDNVIKFSTLTYNLFISLKDKNLSRIYLSSFFVLMSFVSIYYSLISGKLNNNFNNFNTDLMRDVATLGMLTCLISGRLFKYIQPLKILSFALFFMAISLMLQYLFIINGNKHYMIPFLIIHYIFSAMISLAIPSMITCTTLFSNPSNRGGAISLYTCILFIGASLGSYLPGIISPIWFFCLLSIMLAVSALRVIFIDHSLS